MRYLVLAGLLAACGDNGEMCGEGTRNLAGVCTPNAGIECGYGTMLDPASGTCMPDPNICRDGTVLINGTCQDPNANVAIDLEEGPEPNGLEPNANPAGLFSPKAAIGAGFVIHGCIAPTGNVADVDSYALTVSEPTLLEVTAAGVGGLVGGFEVVLDASFDRYGIANMSQTARREVFLPQAGTYRFVVADTRTLTNGGQAAGDPAGTSCYYVTLTHEAMPTPTPLSVPVGTNATITDGKLKFFSAKLTSGFNLLSMRVADPAMAPAIDVLVDDEYRPQLAPYDAVVAGVKDTSSSLVVADYTVNFSYEPVDYVLSFAAATVAQPLAGTATAVVNGAVGDPVNYSNEFYFDADAGEIMGLDITSSVPVRGLVWDQNETAVGDFNNGSDTWTHYRGLWRAQRAGRYYLALTAPSTPVNSMYTLTSTVTPIVPAPLTADATKVGEVTSAFGANVYSVDLASTSWVSFAATSATTGAIALQIFDPAKAFGRFDPLAGHAGISPTFAATLAPTGALVDYIIAAITQSPALVIVRPTNATSTFDLTMATRARTDLGAHAAPYSATTSATAPATYSLETAAGNRMTVTVHPTDGKNPRVRWLNADESTRHTFDATGAGADEVATWGTDGSGVGAFVVENSNAYDLTVAVAAPYYAARTQQLNGYGDACLDGLYYDIHASHFSDALDLASPFVFYGAAHSQFRVSDYGYLTFDLGTATASPVTTLPDGIGLAQIVPQGQLITAAEVCVANRAPKTAVQWRGTGQDGQAVEMVAIVDGSNGSIEFQYTSAHRSATAVSGVQAPTGLEGVAVTPAPFTSIKLIH